MKALVPVRSVSLWLLVIAVKRNPTRFMPVQTSAEVTKAFPENSTQQELSTETLSMQISNEVGSIGMVQCSTVVAHVT